MKYYITTANGSYVREHMLILKDLGSWSKMTDEEKQPFKVCAKCKTYNAYFKNEGESPCPCETCEYRKTEIQVDNQMTKLRRKYLEGEFK